MSSRDLVVGLSFFVMINAICFSFGWGTKQLPAKTVLRLLLKMNIFVLSGGLLLLGILWIFQ